MKCPECGYGRYTYEKIFDYDGDEPKKLIMEYQCKRCKIVWYSKD
jgi:DNA-directed RNA polymerase subunit M/transcription elongation factor TFIIS